MRNKVLNICIIEDDNQEKDSYYAMNNGKIELDILQKKVNCKFTRE